MTLSHERDSSVDFTQVIVSVIYVLRALIPAMYFRGVGTGFSQKSLMFSPV
jgi:hypothetical protein